MKTLFSLRKVGFCFMIILGTVASVNASIDKVLTPKSETVLHFNQSDFEHCTLQGLNYESTVHGFCLTKTSAGDYRSSGTVVSPILKTQFTANNLVSSWNADLPKGTAIKIEVRVKSIFPPFWSPWFEMATFGDPKLNDNHKIKRSWHGFVREDELWLRAGIKHFRYRVTLLTGNPQITPTLKLVSICYADMKNRIPIVDTLLPDTTNQPLWVKDLPVPYRSQTVEDRNISWRACHPTSLSMVLEYYGTKLPTAEVAQCVWDPLNEIFGNWSFNAAFAGSLGYRSWIIRCNSFDPIKKEIAAGHPVILSIKYKRGVLSNAPVKSTQGHIIVCRGFTADGDPICNDPAARTEEKGHIVYKKAELERAWLASKAAAVIVEPNDTNSKSQIPSPNQTLTANTQR